MRFKLYIAITVIFLVMSSCFQSKNNKELTEAQKEQRSAIDAALDKYYQDEEYDKHRCSIDILKSISKRKNSLQQSDIELFLATFHLRCINNIEYQEWSNELLYFVMENYPSETVQLIRRNKGIHFDIILKTIERPVDKDIDIVKTTNSVKNNNSNSEIRDKMLSSLNRAMNN